MNVLVRQFAGALAGIVLACLSFNEAKADSCPPQCPSGKIILGLAVPMSGSAAVFGRQTAKAIEIAIGELNAAGGLMGLPVQLAIGDDRCDWGTASNIATKHIKQDKINFMIGPICPNVAMDATPIYARAGVIQVVPTVTTVELTRRNHDTVFRIAATDEQEAQAFGAFLAHGSKNRKIAVVFSDYRYRRALAEMVKREIPSEMKDATAFEAMPDASGAADRLASKLQRTPPDIVYLALDAGPAVEFIGKMRTRGVKSQLMGGQQMLSQVFWRAAGVSAEGIHVIAPVEIPAGAEFRNAVERLKQADVVPDLVALYSYVAVQVWAEAIRRAGSGDPKKVAEVLRSNEFSTAVGRVAFDSNGDRRNVRYSLVTKQTGPLSELRLAQADPVTAPTAVPPSTASRPQPTASEETLRFEQPITFGPVPVNGRTIKQLADSVPLFPPVAGQDEVVWKKNCSACHQWDRKALCDQGATYATNPQNVLRSQHPFGGPFKLALARWAKGGCL